MATGIGGMELLITFAMLFGGGFGLPVGVPPEPEDELLARIAPPECLFYTTWSGMATADPQSPNQTERLIAEQEIQHLVGALNRQLTAALDQAVGRAPNPLAKWSTEEGPKLAKLLLTRPTAMYLADVKPGPGGPTIEAALMLNAGDEAANVRTALEKLQSELAGDRAEEVSIAGAKFFRLRPAPQAPAITWGTRGKYVILGLGEGAVEKLLQRVRSAPPQWLTDLRKQLPVDRVSTVTYANVSKGLDLVTKLADKPELVKALDALGLNKLTAFGAVGGLDATGFVSRMWLGIDGEPRGVLAPLAAKPLAAQDLAPIPRDALAAVALRLDLEKLLANLLEAARKIEPRAAQEIEGGLAQVEQGLQFRLREDLFRALGDVWTLSTSPADGGLLAGWIATVQVRDSKKLQEIHELLLRQAAQAFGNNPRAPQVRQLEFAGQTIHYLVVPEAKFPLTPAWCLTGDRLAVALVPQALKGYLARDASFRSLAENPAVKPLLKSDAGPWAVSYADTRELFRLFYPLVQIGLQVALKQGPARDLNLDPGLWPSTAAVEKHLLPNTAAVRRTATGVEIVSHGTLPNNIGGAAPVGVALLLPAVQGARQAARRSQSMNNMKQLAVAMHNYHDTFRAFPAAFGTDKDGKPLLSWRVYLLPYVEGDTLFKQFHLDEPWDSDHNKQLIEKMPAVFRSPNSTAAPGKTVYLGVRGEKMIFVPPKKAADRFPLGTGMAQITDGTSNTIMIVEANDASAVIWTKPDDFEPKAENPLDGLLGLNPGGFLAALCDGSVQFIPQTIDKETLRHLFEKADGHAVAIPR